MSTLAFVATFLAIASVVMACLAIKEARRSRRVWRDGHDALIGTAEFSRIEPPRKYQPKQVLMGRLTQSEILDIECRSRESRNLLLGPTPSPLQIANLPQVAHLAIVDVPRLLAHIRRLEDRT